MTHCRSRIVSAQGPTQLLNVIGLLEYLKHETGRHNSDHLLLGGFYSPDRSIVDACFLIAKLWDFKSVHVITNEEKGFESDRDSAAEHLRLRLGVNQPQEIFLCRNWQGFNELIISAFHDSPLVLYGDGFGALDAKLHADDGLSRCRVEYISPSSVYLFVPVLEDHRSDSVHLKDRINTLPLSFLQQVLSKAEALMIDAFYRRRNKEPSVIVTLSNLTESNCINNDPMTAFALWFLRKLESVSTRSENRIIRLVKNCASGLVKLISESIACKEVEMYKKQITRHISKDERILLKPHIRSKYGQHYKLARSLSQSGYSAICIDSSLKAFPTEILLKLFPNLRRCHAMMSSSAIGIEIRNLSNDSPITILPDIDEDIKNQFIREKWFKAFSATKLHNFAVDYIHGNRKEPILISECLA